MFFFRKREIDLKNEMDEDICAGGSFVSGSFIFQGIGTHLLVYFVQTSVTSPEDVISLAKRRNGAVFNEIGF